MTPAPAQGWNAPELGLPRALALATLLTAGLLALLLWLTVSPRPQPGPPLQVMRVTLTTLPRPAPPTPPEPQPAPRHAAPPKPAPAPAAAPPPPAIPAPSKIPAAALPPAPARPAAKPALRAAPPKPAPAPAAAPPQPATPPPPVISGLAPYGEAMYRIIQANQDVPDALAQLGLSGTAIIELLVAPSGHILSAKLHHSSGSPLIDQTALQHAAAAALPPFNSQMPQTPHLFLVPVQISPAG